MLEVRVKVNPVPEEEQSGLEKLMGTVRDRREEKQERKEETEKDGKETPDEPEPVLIGGNTNDRATDADNAPAEEEISHGEENKE